MLSSTIRCDFLEAVFFDLTVVGEASDIVSIRLIFRTRGDRSDTVAPLSFAPGRYVEASHRWYTKNLTIPPGMPVEYYWVIADAAGNQLRTEKQIAYYHDARFDWQEVQNEDITVFWYEGSEEVGQTILNSAAAALKRLSAATKTRLEYPIRIILYANIEDFRSAFPYLNQWVSGMAFPEAALIVGIAGPDKTSLSHAMDEMIPHEISHLLFYQATFHPYSDPPTWLDEGLAKYNENAPHDDEIALVQRAVQRGELLSLAQISGSFPPDGYTAMLSYAESLSVVQFILERYGPQTMSTLLHAFKEGKTTDEALRYAFGLSLEDFEIAWKEYLAQLPTPQEPVWSFPLDEKVFRPRLLQFWGGLLCCGVVLVSLLTLAIVQLKRSRSGSQAFLELEGTSDGA